MEIVYFTVTGIIVYVLADTIVRKIEQKRGALLANRSVVFFLIFLPLALVSFQLIRYLMKQG